MPSTKYSKPPTDFKMCRYCGTRIIFSCTAEGKKLPPVNYAPDPLGTMAVRHAPPGAWLGRFLAKDEQPAGPEKRHAQHWCDGLERQRRHRRGRPLTRGRPARNPQPALDLWTTP